MDHLRLARRSRRPAVGSAFPAEADAWDHLAGESPQGRQVLEADLEMADPNIDQPLDLTGYVGRRGAKDMEDLAGVEAMLVGGLKRGRILGQRHDNAAGEHDLLEWPADRLAFLAQDLVWLAVDLFKWSVPVPRIGEPGRHRQRLWAVGADHDRDRHVRPWLAVGILDLVVRAVIGGRRLGPHGAQDLDRLAHLRYAGAAARIFVVVGAVLLLVPAGADAQDEASAGQHLQ